MSAFLTVGPLVRLKFIILQRENAVKCIGVLKYCVGRFSSSALPVVGCVSSSLFSVLRL